MTYHLSRVEHWIQNRNIEFYPTNINRQLIFTPFAEYIILHWRLITNNDVLVNFIQYVSMLLSVLLSILIVKTQKGNKLTQLFAAILTATVPMGIMQSTSTQNDYVVALFLLATIYFSLKNDILYLALSVGLGVFTKNTYLIFAFPFVLYWLFKYLRIERKKTMKGVLLIIIFTVLINISHWRRNFAYYDSPLGPKIMIVGMTNQSYEPKYIMSNIVRNIASQIGLPNKKYNGTVDSIVHLIHTKIGLATNDPKVTWVPASYATLFATHEDRAGNYVLVVLFALAVLMAFFKKSPLFPTYITLFTGWVLFIILLKWQPWQSRLELPFFIASCPFIALTITQEVKREVWIKLFCVILIALSFPFVLGYLPFDSKNVDAISSNRPLTLNVLTFKNTRYERFLLESPVNRSYDALVKKIKQKGLTEIGLNLGVDSWEYPLWVALRRQGVTANISNVNSASRYDAVISDNTEGSLNYKPDNAKETVRFGNLEMTLLK